MKTQNDETPRDDPNDRARLAAAIVGICSDGPIDDRLTKRLLYDTGNLRQIS